MWGAVSVQKFMAVTVQFSPEIFLDYTPNHISSNDTLKSVAYRANPFIHLKVSKSERHYNVFHLHDSPHKPRVQHPTQYRHMLLCDTLEQAVRHELEIAAK